MNKVESFYNSSFYKLEHDINKFAEVHEIINVSIAANTTSMGTRGYSAMVLYKL